MNSEYSSQVQLLEYSEDLASPTPTPTVTRVTGRRGTGRWAGRRLGSRRWSWPWPRRSNSSPRSVSASKPWKRASPSETTDPSASGGPGAGAVRPDFLYEVRGSRRAPPAGTGPTSPTDPELDRPRGLHECRRSAVCQFVGGSRLVPGGSKLWGRDSLRVAEQVVACDRPTVGSQ